MGWYSPLDRAILPLDGLRISRSLRKSIKRYEVRIDTAFDDVLDGCADRRRPSGWINREIRRVYRRLHKRGVVHSVEAWTPGGELAGGLYGVSIGGLFAGESMFYRPDIGRDASKVALVALVDLLGRAGPEGRLLDVQWQTPHMASLGVVELPREEYLRRLAVALQLPTPTWTSL
jgi:leucyl/phenylalanyl-tRNA--protein transferase